MFIQQLIELFKCLRFNVVTPNKVEEFAIEILREYHSMIRLEKRKTKNEQIEDNQHLKSLEQIKRTKAVEKRIFITKCFSPNTMSNLKP